MIYKVSYVVKGGGYPGAIQSEDAAPEVGQTVQIGPMEFKIIDVHEIMPPRGNYHHLHATVEPFEKEEDGD